MLYNQPLDQPSSPNAPYIDGNPNAGIQGSIVPAASIEFDQREVVEVISRANSRGYVDFSGTPCAPPGNQDLMQLRKAIEGFITGWSFIIDTTITFRVHGAGYDFVDLNAAMAYLRKYYITPQGHVILQCAGAASGATKAAQYIYTQPIRFTHPNNNRISVYGAPVLALVPRTDAGYASNGPSAPQRAADTANNLAMLRTKFATELYFTNGPYGSSGDILGAAMSIGTSVPTLMNLDGFLLTTDGSVGVAVGWLSSYGWMNASSGMGLAASGFTTGGFYFELGCAVAIEGPGNSDTTYSCLISIGNGQGTVMADGSYLTMFGNVVSLASSGDGFVVWPRCGCQMDGGVFSCSNAGQGFNSYVGGASFISGANSAGTVYMPSHFWKNGQWGGALQTGVAQVNGDFGAGTGNANAAGSVLASWGANFHAMAGDLHISGACTPAWNTVGNGNAWIG